MVSPDMRQRAPFACDPAGSRGRIHDEPASPTRSPFQRDRDRIVHSTAFRRLKDKTQVFVYHEGDHYRTRLTHSLEVAQIARSMARTLGLDEDLTEALALAHDLGHTPFGHAGERALGRCLKDHGGFDHNIQTFRIVTALESRYASFDGLNLTLETLEGIIKHNGPISGDRPVFAEIAAIDGAHGLWLDRQAPAEAQLAALADDIAYDAHDVDDGLRAGLFETDALEPVPVISQALREVSDLHGPLERPRLAYEAVRRMITAMIDDVLAETARRISAHRPETAGDIRALDQPVVAFSEAMAANDREIKSFLDRNMYKHPDVLSRATRAEAVVEDLFEAYCRDPARLPEPWRRDIDGEGAGTEVIARRIGDFIAGMTDRFAVEQHRRLFDLNPFAATLGI